MSSVTLERDSGNGVVQPKLLDSFVFNKLLASIIREELETALDWSILYSLAWLYSLSQNMGLQEGGLYDIIKRIVLSLLEDEKRYRIAVYDHEGAVGILFSLHHMAKRGEDNIITYSNKVLRDVEKLHWHGFDGEVMAFSYTLASLVKAKDISTKLEKDIDNSLNEWLKNLDYESQRNIVYILFGFAYTSDVRLVEVIKSLKLYSFNSYLLQSIINSSDVELIALTLYVLGKLAYGKNKKLRKMLGRNIVRNIRCRIIPTLGATLEKRIAELGLLSDLASVPRDLIAKIQLARIESGLDKPFMLSKYEWRAYQEALKVFKRGYYRVHRRHLIVGLVLNATLLPLSTIIVLVPILPDLLRIILTYYELIRWVSAVIISSILYINISLCTYGSIEGVLRDIRRRIMDLLEQLVKR